MKTLLSLLILFIATSQINAAKLTVTILYETLCHDSMNFFKNQVWPTMQDPKIRENVFIELVPFGRAHYTENPWSITCQHGPEECYGNVMNACFMARQSDNFKQVAFVSCCMSDSDPPNAGEQCAKQLGYSFKGVKECTTDKEGISLQIKYGQRTLHFGPKLGFVPTIIYNNVYNQKDQDDSLRDFKAVIIRKIKTMGVRP